MSASSRRELVRIKPRFARSANVERDDFALAIDGYVPTARAMDVVTRVVAGLTGSGAERAISVTGPYGSGKSSLALFLGALFGPPGAIRDGATDLLRDCDDHLAGQLEIVRRDVGEDGFVLCAAVAQREAVTTTILRALRNGLARYRAVSATDENNTAMVAVESASEALSARELRNLIDGVSTIAPVIIVLDEFGKNLEQFVATGGAEDDLFVLQDIAEWAASSVGHPVVLLTLQHLSFEDYAAGASAAKRREWSKVQGRFADVPYVESPAQAQALIASVFDRRIDLHLWSEAMEDVVRRAGIADQLYLECDRLYPLHPVTAAVLPELCSRYGQNERTLFSFLAGPDPGAVPAFLTQVQWREGDALPSVSLSRVYDFFLASASTMVSASSSAARWLEIETRIRDAVGLQPAELTLLKSIAVMNLVTAGGALRASRALLLASVESELRAEDFDRALSSLEQQGLVTYRAFADEYRVWSGSDFDLKGAVELARRRLQDEPLETLIERVRPQSPVVAARHSQKTGTLRVFRRVFVGASRVVSVDESQMYDGVVLLDLSSSFSRVADLESDRPIVIGRSPHVNEIAAAGRELGALLDVLNAAEGQGADWVARRELSERAAAAASALDHAIERAFGLGCDDVTWKVVGSDSPRRQRRVNLSTVLSDLCDRRYPYAPIIRNEMLSRRELTSQGARARRELLQAMVSSPRGASCGLDGFGPERAMYEAILARPGIHRAADNGDFEFGPPVDLDGDDSDLNFGPAWMAIEDAFNNASSEVMPLLSIYQRLMAPPFGLKEGPIPVLVVAALLVHAQEVALYEDGSFVTRLDPPTIERLIRNPDLFSFKNYATTGPQREVVERLGALLRVSSGIGTNTRVASIVNVVGPLLARARSLPYYSQRTRQLSEPARAVRGALFAATEPDLLIFEDLPQALGLRPISPSDPTAAELVDSYIGALSSALDELKGLFRALLDRMERILRVHLAIRGDDLHGVISARVSEFADLILDADVKAFVFALSDRQLDRDEWLGYLGMVVTSKAVESWSDEDVTRFELRAHELSSAVRRIEGLYHGQTAPAEGFTAVRVSLTLPDGTDRPRVVWVDESVADHLRMIVEQCITAVDELVGHSGPEMLLAMLAMEVLGRPDSFVKGAWTEPESVRKVV